jgi:drug/metabolite transporter (DMT)-like permease
MSGCAATLVAGGTAPGMLIANKKSEYLKSLMERKLLTFSLVILLAAVGVFADALLKQASQQPRAFLSVPFLSGMVLYALTAFGWIIVLRHMTLASAGAVYAVSVVLLLVVVGVGWFGETVSLREKLGIAMAVCSLALLAKFG